MCRSVTSVAISHQKIIMLLLFLYYGIIVLFYRTSVYIIFLSFLLTFCSVCCILPPSSIFFSFVVIDPVDVVVIVQLLFVFVAHREKIFCDDHLTFIVEWYGIFTLADQPLRTKLYFGGYIYVKMQIGDWRKQPE